MPGLAESSSRRAPALLFAVLLAAHFPGTPAVGSSQVPGTYEDGSPQVPGTYEDGTYEDTSQVPGTSGDESDGEEPPALLRLEYQNDQFVSGDDAFFSSGFSTPTACSSPTSTPVKGTFQRVS